MQKHTMRRAALLWLLPAVASVFIRPTHAQNTDITEEPYVAPPGARAAPIAGASFAQLMSGKSIPLKLKLKDLTRDYRRIALGGQSDPWSMQMQMMAARIGVELGVYYTKGQTVTLGGETYLVAYRPQVTLPAEIWNFHGQDALAETTRPGPDTTLALSLLNLRTSGSLNDVRPFDPKLDMGTPQEGNAASVRQLERLGRGLLTYVRGRGRGSLPQMGATITPATRRAVYPFIQDPRLWNHPTTEEPYRPNPNLSGKNPANVKNPAQTVFFYEAKPAGDGTRAVLFLDGHVVRVIPAQWQRLGRLKVALRSPGERAVTLALAIKSTLNGIRALRNSAITVAATGAPAVVTLSGTVPVTAHSRIAEGVARREAPGFRIVNRLKVQAARPTARRAAR